ncbi:MAG: glutamate--tRNA ligase [Planctomycetota bacterium]
MSAPIRVRFAPSPTGYLHIGGARTALYNWLLARQQGGTFVLRMEDTDEERNTDAARQTIFRGLDWLGLTPDEGPEQGGPHGPYSQSERMPVYLEWAERLKESGALYPCFATREELAELRARQEAEKAPVFGYDGRYRDLDPAEARRRIAAGEEHTWRLRVPRGETVVLKDLIRGDVAVSSDDIEDIILLRANGTPVYNLAVVIDDHDMAITHVIRGEDHLTNTFKQLIIYRALGWDEPTFAHLPLILGPSGEGKLSKRKHPEAALELYQQKGYPVEAVVNWLAMIGWSLDDKTEIMSREELVRSFGLDRVSAAGARLPMDKLDWLSGEYIRAMSLEEVEAGFRPFLVEAGRLSADPNDAERLRLRRIAAAEKDRVRRFGEIVERTDWVFAAELDFEPKALANLGKAEAASVLEGYLGEVLPKTDVEDPAAMEADARSWAEGRGLGFGKFVHPVRAALTGRTAGPGLFDCVAILGREESARRLAAGLERARGASAGGA